LQAARDGLLDLVDMHLAMYNATNIHDLDDDGFTALHHAARYNRVKVLERLLAAGGGQ
jgi:ankyrin repeat protein